MSSLLFAIEVLAVLAVIFWARKNDRMPLDGGGTGLLALRDSGTGTVARKEPRWRTGAPARHQPDGGIVNAAQPHWKPRKLPSRR